MQEGWRQMWSNWRYEYYSPPILLVLAFAVWIVFLIAKKRFRGMRLLQIHAAASFLQLAGVYIGYFFLKLDIVNYQTYSVIIFIIIEAACFFYFVLPFIIKGTRKKFATILFAVFIIWAWGHFIFNRHSRPYLMLIMLAECLLVITTCCLYYYSLLRQTNGISLLRIPHFWIVTAMLFLICVATPSSIIDYAYISRDATGRILSVMHALVFMAYAILFATYLGVYIWFYRKQTKH